MPVLLVACGGGADPPEAFPCEVAPLFADFCQSCHGPELQFGAPVHLEAPADLHAPSALFPDRTVLAEVRRRVRLSTGEAMPPLGLPRPDESALRALEAWLDRGAPAASADERCP